MKVGRNDPCPCGSGAKVKRCCGVAGAQRSRAAFEDLFELACAFPRQRPQSASFAAWAERAPETLDRELLEEGLDALGAAEEHRIPSEFAAAYPRMWNTILDDAGDRDEALQTLLTGAVVAGLAERQRELDPVAIELLELDADARSDPVESLALALDAGDLWSVLEAAQAADVFDRGASLADVADELWSEWHERRLEALIHRLRRRVPIAGFPAASSAIEDACRAFERGRDVRLSLRAELLLDALPPAGALGLAA
jgi:hypothetical protein